jgi:DNA-binding XRE family transcriptional regulator
MLKNSVKKWRESSRISKAHLARQVGVCRSYITRLEAGILQPSGNVMFRIAGYFRVPIEQIFQHVEEQNPKQIFFGPKTLTKGNKQFPAGLGQTGVPVSGRSARPSSGSEDYNGQIVGRSNGEGRGVPVAQ